MKLFCLFAAFILFLAPLGRPVYAEITGSTKTYEKNAGVSNMGGFDLVNGTVLMNNDTIMATSGLGTYSLHGDTCVNSVYTALADGYRLIDTAHAYGNEAEVGQAVRKAIADGIVTRDEVIVITKLYPDQYSHPEEAIEEALANLDLEYIDILLLHHPAWNDVQVYQVMEKYVEAGKIHALGLSCYYIDELDAFLPQIHIKPVLVQNEIHPYYSDREVTRYTQSKGIAVQAWYLLGGRGHQTELLHDPVLEEIASTHGKSVAQVIIRWNLQNGVIVIPGSSNPDHMLENISVYDFKLTENEMQQIDALNRDEKHDWY